MAFPMSWRKHADHDHVRVVLRHPQAVDGVELELLAVQDDLEQSNAVRRDDAGVYRAMIVVSHLPDSDVVRQVQERVCLLVLLEYVEQPESVWIVLQAIDYRAD
jgi:hypothetical protein